jgi:hypothetical protein
MLYASPKDKITLKTYTFYVKAKTKGGWQYKLIWNNGYCSASDITTFKISELTDKDLDGCATECSANSGCVNFLSGKAGADDQKCVLMKTGSETCTKTINPNWDFYEN